MSSLQELVLYSNPITTLPDSLEKSSIKSLNCYMCQLSKVPRALSRMPNLEELFLTENKLTTFDSENGYKNLVSLEISNNKISKLGDMHFPRLKSITMKELPVKSLPNSFFESTELEELDLYGTQITSLPPAITKFTNLKKLVSNSYIKSLPENIGNLKNLERIEIPSANMKKLPASIGQLSRLKYLDLSFNKLSKLPAEFANLTSLESLDLKINSFKVFPKEIFALKSLKRLIISDNSIKVLPSDIRNLTNLEWLEISMNKLNVLPPEFSQLQKLKYLSAAHNNLKAFPPALTNLENLEHLYLGANNISRVPADLSGMTNLDTLALLVNPLNKFPNGVLTIPKLRKLLLGGTKIKSVSDAIWEKPGLCEIQITSNNLPAALEKRAEEHQARCK